jgi:hypothetical protein
LYDADWIEGVDYTDVKSVEEKEKVDEYDDDDYQDQDDNVVTEEILFANPNQPHEQDHMKEAPVDDDHGEPPAVQLQRTGRARLQRRITDPDPNASTDGEQQAHSQVEGIQIPGVTRDCRNSVEQVYPDLKQDVQNETSRAMSIAKTVARTGASVVQPTMLSYGLKVQGNANKGKDLLHERSLTVLVRRYHPWPIRRKK